MTKEIEVARAGISRCSVSIDVIRIDNRQMTLSVFRQLPIGEESAESDLWGTVRYELDGRELWLVFSEGGRLFRRPLYLQWAPASNSRGTELLGRVIAARITGGDEERSANLEYQTWARDFVDREKVLAGLRQLFIAV